MGEYREINVQEAQTMITGGKVTIVDIRDPAAYGEAHIPQAQTVNPQNIQQFLESADKKLPLICYCYHGISSRSAAQYFQQNGFGEVFSIVGGFEEYRLHYPTQ